MESDEPAQWIRVVADFLVWDRARIDDGPTAQRQSRTVVGHGLVEGAVVRLDHAVK